jgi:hypothetical protein
MQIGDINVVESIINTEIRLAVLERAFDFIMSNNYSLTKPSQQDIENFKKQALKDLQTRYPNMGIQAK